MLGNVFILGDSYSTFEGYIPDGYGCYYFSKGPNYLPELSKTECGSNDVCNVEQTWWYPIVKENGNLVQNCSWSGTTICNTGYDGKDNSEVSFIARMEKLSDAGFFEENKIDTFFLFGGSNDSWSDAPLGEPMNSGWKKDDLYCVLPAFGYLIDLLVNKLKNVRIYCIINTALKPAITEYYKSVCAGNGVDIIELHDIDKVCGHPTIKGMAQIKEQILDYLRNA